MRFSDEPETQSVMLPIKAEVTSAFGSQCLPAPLCMGGGVSHPFRVNFLGISSSDMTEEAHIVLDCLQTEVAYVISRLQVENYTPNG